MGLKLPWKPSDRMGLEAECGGYTLHVLDNPSLADMMAGHAVMYEWRVFRHSWSVQVGGRGADEPRNTRPTMVEAQEAAEAAAGRLLAEDAGVRALLGLRWIPVREALPPEGVDVQVIRARLDGTRYVCARKWLPARPSWVPDSEPTPLGVWSFGAWAPVNDADHWRPLDVGPVAAKSDDSANLAATAGEGEP